MTKNFVKKASILLTIFLVLFTLLPASGALANENDSGNNSANIDENNENQVPIETGEAIVNDDEVSIETGEAIVDDDEVSIETGEAIVNDDEVSIEIEEPMVSDDQKSLESKEILNTEGQDSDETETALINENQEKVEEPIVSENNESAENGETTTQESNEKSQGKESEELEDNEEASGEITNALNVKTEIHLHLNACIDQISKVLVNLKGELHEMSNPGNSPIYTYPDDGTYIKEDVVGFKVVTEDGEETEIHSDSLRLDVGKEAEGTINYWQDTCEKTEDSDGGTNNENNNDQETEEQTDTPGQEPEETEETPASDNTVETQINLHLNACIDQISKVLVNLKGELHEMANPGNSPIYTYPDDGTYIKEDVVGFKVVTADGEETEILSESLRLDVGKEAEGTINYWQDTCEKTEDSDGGTNNENNNDQETEEPPANDDNTRNTQIHLHLNECIDLISKVLVNLKGEWHSMENPGNSSIYTYPDGGKYIKEEVRGFKVITVAGEETEFHPDNLRLDLGTEAEGTINYWLEDCEVSEDENNQDGTPDNDGKEDEATEVPEEDKNGEGTKQGNEEDEADEAGTPGGEDADNGGEVNDSDGSQGDKYSDGVLPQTGEKSNMMFYVLGSLLAAAGAMLRFRKTSV
ncbi:LPXTG cell wall anchor domain-containing protein [Mesobacillus harenae]|uniref:LPXTG cell wall anchor domain-containing protein n=1 Tax=Mesobacillus harenae TaxID=2213203 RepID=UPI0015810F08|nr:LPXTG cell wall anchor domain-containing protein [Mesobacillus harenae]